MITVRGVEVPEYSAAIFFDNDRNKIANVADKCPAIRGHAVPETAYEIHGSPLNFPPLKNIINAAGGENNSYVKFLRKNLVTYDYYDPISGINPVVHRPVIEEWLHTLEMPATSIIIIDWDRTMTIIEGFYNCDYDIFKNDPRTRELFATFTKEQLYEDMLRYLLGGDERLVGLRSIFSIIGDLKIHICILTNNGSCSSNLFKELVNQLMPESVENLFIACSKPAPFYGHKGNKLKSIAPFRRLCNVMGGGSGSQSTASPSYKRKKRNTFGKRKMIKRKRTKRRARKIQ